MKTLHNAVSGVKKLLDDYPNPGSEQVWTWAEIERHVKDGYNSFTRRTECLFDMFYPEDLAICGNYVAEWELDYFDSGMVRHGIITFTGGHWEQDYAPAGHIGPINLTQPWERDYLSTTFPVSRVRIPEDNVTIDRVTWDWRALDPEYTQWMEKHDRNFQTNQGDPWRFNADRDGIGYMRVQPAGTGGYSEFTISGNFGLLRNAADTEIGTTWDPDGERGTLMESPEHFAMGPFLGIPRRLYSDDSNTRVEHYRVGKDLDGNDFEIPDRFVKYVEFYAAGKALEREGPGQDLQLSQHFTSRFEEGVMRMRKRLAEMKRSRRGRIGGTVRHQRHPGPARLPWRFGKQISRGAW